MQTWIKKNKLKEKNDAMTIKKPTYISWKRVENPVTKDEQEKQSACLTGRSKKVTAAF